MYKLIILVESTATPGFNAYWPRFLHAAENIPGLRREATSRVTKVLYGDVSYAMVHELFFDSMTTLQSGLASPSGMEAGKLLQEMTGGRVKLLIATHSEDDLENIQKYKKRGRNAGSQSGRA